MFVEKSFITLNRFYRYHIYLLLFCFSKYLVVDFPDETTKDKSIPMALISSAWVFEKNKNIYCYWPTYLKSTAKREKAVINHEELDAEKSQICPITIKYSSGIFFNY